MSDIALKAQEEMLFLDVSDEVLEAAAGAAKVHASFIHELHPWFLHGSV